MSLLRLRRRERGQILVMAAILLPVLLAMAGMAVDVGTYASERRSLQNAADSIALAAGQELPDGEGAQARAAEYAGDYGIDPGDLTVTVTGGTTTPRVRVVIDRPHDFVFMGILGIEQADVGAVASAGKFSYGGGAGVVPWSIEQDLVDASASGDIVTVKYDSGGPTPGNGNFGAIRIDGNGASDYESSGKYGADATICSVQTANCTTSSCPGTFPTGCAENSGECDGPACDPKTGNMTGPTKDIVDFRMDNTDSGCDTFEEAFTAHTARTSTGLDSVQYSFSEGVSAGGRMAAPGRHHGAGSHATFTPTAAPATNTPTWTPTRTNTPAPTATPSGPTSTPAPPTSTHTPGATNTPSSGGGGGDIYGINPDCNPWGGGACASSSSQCSRRIFLIPIIDDFGNGSSSPVEIQGFALVYLEGYEGSCTGNSCDVRVRFVKTNATIGQFAGDYIDGGYNNFVKLTE